MKVTIKNINNHKTVDIEGDTFRMFWAIDQDLTPIESLRHDVERINDKITRLKFQAMRLRSAITELENDNG